MALRASQLTLVLCAYQRPLLPGRHVPCPLPIAVKHGVDDCCASAGSEQGIAEAQQAASGDEVLDDRGAATRAGGEREGRGV